MTEEEKKATIREKHPGRVTQGYNLTALMKKRKEQRRVYRTVYRTVYSALHRTVYRTVYSIVYSTVK